MVETACPEQVPREETGFVVNLPPSATAAARVAGAMTEIEAVPAGPRYGGDALRGLARGAGSAFTVNAVGAGLGFLTDLVLARTLGVESYGIYAYVIAWVTILALLGALGFPTALLRFAAAYRAKEQWSLLRGIIRYALRRVLLAGLAVAILGAAAVLALGERLGPELAQTFLVGLAVVPVFALLKVHSSIARAFGRVVAALAPATVLRPGIVLLGVGLLGVSLYPTVNATMAMAIMLLATLLSLALLGATVWRSRPAPLATTPAAAEPQLWQRTSLFLLLMAGTQVVLNRADVIMLGWLADTSTAGIYAIAFRVAALAGFALTAVNLVFAPTLAALHARKDRVGLQATVTSVARWSLTWALLVSLPLLILAEPILGLFGEPFRSGAPALRILLVGQLVGAALGSVSLTMTMTGLERQATVVMAATAGICVALHAVMIPLFGIVGAAIASTVALMGWKVAMAVLVWTNHRITPGVLPAQAGPPTE